MMVPDHLPPRRFAAPAFIGVELAFLAVAHVLGGPPWVALGVLACVMQVLADFRLRSLVGIVPALGWLVASYATGNRELFFPYAVYLAAHVASQFAGLGWKTAAVAGGTVVMAFLMIRVLQNATLPVLAVEFVVAMAILAGIVCGIIIMAKRPWASMALATMASIAAYAGLAL
jgi:hypothetical protein